MVCVGMNLKIPFSGCLEPVQSTKSCHRKSVRKKSISGIRIIVRQILPCNPSDGLKLTRLKVCQSPTICKGSNFCQSLTKISPFFWNIEPFKNILPLLIRMSCQSVIWHQSNQNSCKVKANRR